jgi:hypothetical protein
MASERELGIGVNVRFTYGHRDVIGNIKEDRGAIGKGGRRLYRITFQSEPGHYSEIELPADSLQVEHHGFLPSSGTF